jgi:hypothetical protein
MGSSDIVHRQETDHAAALQRSLLFLFFVAGYFTVNFAFRLAHYEFFSGHGAYGWPRPSSLKLFGMMLAAMAAVVTVGFVSVIAVEALCGVLPARAARNTRAPLYVALASFALCAAETDNSWYALSHAHIRFVDIRVFLQSDLRAHFGIAPADIVPTVVACVIHVAVCTALYRATDALNTRLGRRVDIGILRSIVVATVSIAVVFGTVVGARLGATRDSQWRAISKHNIADLTSAHFYRDRFNGTAAMEKLVLQTSTPSDRPSTDERQSAWIAPANAPIRHILIVALEGWNGDYLSGETMPFMMSLAKRSVVASRHYSSGNNTLLGTLGLLYGASPAYFYGGEWQPSQSPYIADLLASGWQITRLGSGLESYRDIDGYLGGLTKANDNGDPDRANELIRRHIEGAQSTLDYYYYEHTHFPYVHSAKYSHFGPEPPERISVTGGISPDLFPGIRNAYRNALQQADDSLSRLLADLDLASTLVVITGDHGEALGEKGRVTHSSSLEREQIQTPLLMLYPGVRPTTLHLPTSHLDVMPTIFEMLGKQIPAGTQGDSWLSPPRNKAALSVHTNQYLRPFEFAVVGANLKLIVDAKQLSHPVAADLLTVNDSPQTYNAETSSEADGLFRFYVSASNRIGCLVGVQPSERPASTAVTARNCR